MIVKRSVHLRRLMSSIGPQFLVLLGFDIVVTYLYIGRGWTWLGQDNLPLPLFGTAVALIVTLRNNAAYARWWEARALWGQVVNDSRSFVRGLIAMTGDPALQVRLTRQQVAYALALRNHLLRRPPWPDIERLLTSETVARVRPASNVPLALQADIADRLGIARRAGLVDPMSLAALNASLSALSSAQGGLERIKNTPLPRQYNLLPRVFSMVFCGLLPFGMVHDLGLLTPFGSALVGFMFLALDKIGRDLEDPFDNGIYDVPLTSITTTIEINLRQLLGETNLPAPITAVDGVLW